jgi:two-component system LytT family response regulator
VNNAAIVVHNSAYQTQRENGPIGSGMRGDRRVGGWFTEAAVGVEVMVEAGVRDSYGMGMSTRVLIVDDEAIARKGLRSLLSADPDVTIVGEAANGREAVAAIRDKRPTLVFLDIQMPELDGFAVIEEIGVDAMPATIFVTAYDQYALAAFEVHAVDYLLKPFDRERFARALDHAKRRLQQPAETGLGPDTVRMIESLRAHRRYTDRLLVNTEGRIIVVKTADIRWIEAADNYVRLHVGKSKYLHNESMRALEQRLDPTRFVRVHRSAMVNVDSIQEIQPWYGGGLVVIVHGGERLTVSRSYRERVLALDHPPE